MVASIVVSWFVGLIFLFILLLYTQDIGSIEQTELQMPIAQLFLVSDMEGQNFIPYNMSLSLQTRMQWDLA